MQFRGVGGGGGVDKLLKSGQDLRASSLSMTHSLSALSVNFGAGGGFGLCQRGRNPQELTHEMDWDSAIPTVSCSCTGLLR